MTTLERIQLAAKEARLHGQHPTKVYLTVDDGRNLQFELLSAGHHLAHRIEKEGIRHAVHRIAGLEVVWRSPEFGVG